MNRHRASKFRCRQTHHKCRQRQKFPVRNSSFPPNFSLCTDPIDPTPSRVVDVSEKRLIVLRGVLMDLNTNEKILRSSMTSGKFDEKFETVLAAIEGQRQEHKEEIKLIEVIT